MSGFKNILLTFLLFVSATQLFSQAPKYSNEFLSIGVGARSLAMSNSTVASVNDVTSTYWNPAGIMHISNSMQLGVMHNEYFAGIANYDYGALAARIDEKSAFGFSIYRFGVDNIPNTLELIDNDGNLRYDRIRSFSVADYAFMASYARKSSTYEGLFYGANIKVIRRIAGDFASAVGFGLDFGAQYFYNNWKFGIMGRDITSTFNFWSFNNSQLEEVFLATNNEIPENSLEITLPKFILGASRTFTINDKFEALAEINADLTTDGKRNVLIRTNSISLDPHLGGEINYKKLVFFRLGFGNFQSIPDFDKNDFTFQPNIGLGIKLNRLSLNYALTDIGNQSIALYSNVFSLQFAIDKNSVMN
ncbi:MAG: PorV/PorQ family protein [Chlorobi bacterium]|nr:PorV/PorQ family protein [Chlorobiota bacterium]